MPNICHKTHNCDVYQHSLLNLMRHLALLPRHLPGPKVSITVIWLSLGAYFWQHYCASKIFTSPPPDPLTQRNGPQFTLGINGTQCACIGHERTYRANVAGNRLIRIGAIVARG